MHGQAESGLFDLGHELGLCACELQSCDVANYSFQRASSRSVRWIALWLVRLVGLASGFVLIGPSGAAQAQVQIQTAIGGGTYQMPLGMIMSEDMLMSEQDVSPRAIRRRIPIGDDALGQIKTNQPVAPAQRQGPFTSAPQPPPSESPTVPPSCQTNSAVGFLPSDIHGAAGPANIVTVTNVEVGVYNKTNCALVSKVSLKTFFNAFSIPATQTLFDPRVLYDPAVDRFFVSADSDDSTNTDQFQYFAVSTDNTGTTWFQYRFFLSQGGSFFCKQAANRSWDYPSAGYSSARWFITANDFGITTVRGAIISIDKAPSLVGTAPSAICFNDLVFNIAPPLVQDSSTTPYFLSPGSGSGNSITRYQLTEGASVGSDTLSTTSPITVTAWTVAPDAAQPNGQRLDTLDGRFQSASIQNGTSLWNVHAVNNGRAVARLYQFSTTGTAPLFTIDLFTASDDNVFNPSVATNAADAFVTATRTWPSQGAPTGNAAMLMFRGPNSSSAGYTFDVVATSATQFTVEFDGVRFVPCNTVSNEKTSASCRWGDYSATQIDPSSTAAAWGFNQLITGATSGNWATGAALDLGTAESDWQIAGTGDFNGDGKSDILWRHISGAVAIWLMNGFNIQSNGLVGTPGNGWQIAGTGDFNGDGKSDILWRHISGAVAIWLMNGFNIQSNGLVGTPGNGWQIAGTGDFNGDGKSDILWRHISGAVAIWLMNGFNIQANGLVGTPGNEWQIAGTGDFNGDGKSDILWRQISGAVAIWLMNGFNIQANGLVGTPGNEWQIAGTGDFNGDGKSDILWRQISGAVAIWLMNGFNIQANGLVGTPGNEWQIAGTGDFNGDGKSDILWRQISGAVAIWLMNGFNIQANGLIGTP